MKQSAIMVLIIQEICMDLNNSMAKKILSGDIDQSSYAYDVNQLLWYEVVVIRRSYDAEEELLTCHMKEPLLHYMEELSSHDIQELLFID